MDSVARLGLPLGPRSADPKPAGMPAAMPAAVGSEPLVVPPQLQVPPSTSTLTPSKGAELVQHARMFAVGPGGDPPGVKTAADKLMVVEAAADAATSADRAKSTGVDAAKATYTQKCGKYTNAKIALLLAGLSALVGGPAAWPFLAVMVLNAWVASGDAECARIELEHAEAGGVGLKQPLGANWVGNKIHAFMKGQGKSDETAMLWAQRGSVFVSSALAVSAALGMAAACLGSMGGAMIPALATAYMLCNTDSFDEPGRDNAGTTPTVALMTEGDRKKAQEEEEARQRSDHALDPAVVLATEKSKDLFTPPVSEKDREEGFDSVVSPLIAILKDKEEGRGPSADTAYELRRSLEQGMPKRT